MRLNFIWASAALAILLACSRAPAPNALKESWNRINHPAQMGEYIFEFDALPAHGQHEAEVWSGDYWPTYKSGIAQRWQLYGLTASTAYPLLQPDEWTSFDLKILSPAEKYDLYAGQYDFPLTLAERDRTMALRAIKDSPDYIPGFTIPSWEGLCHGWAPATLVYSEPNPVTLTNADGLEIPFGSADIKALLSLLMDEGLGSNVRFLGRRCEADFAELQMKLRSGEIDKRTYDWIVEGLACRDTNAGSFHIVLANELGLHKKGFLADISRDYQVWNQGLYEYSSQFGEIKQQKSPNSAPATVYEVEVETSVQYIQEMNNAWNAEGSLDGRIFGTVYYRYRLELNAAREIIGGAWISENRPDFLWGMTRARGTNLLPKLAEIYQASTGEALFSPQVR